MQPIKGFDKVQASGDFERLPAGGYVIRITDAKDEPSKSYLAITFDIAEGKFAGHYKDVPADLVAIHQFIRSYKDTAVGMFKAFINAVEASNDGYKWAWDEKTLVGKIVGVIMGEEEYENNRGEVKTGLKVRSCRPADAIRSGNYKVPEPKKLVKADAIPEGFTALADTDLPF